MGEEPPGVRILADGGILLDRREIGLMVAELIYYGDRGSLVLFMYSRVHSWMWKRYEIVDAGSIPYINCGDDRYMVAPDIDMYSIKTVWDMLSVVEKYCKSKST